MFDDNNEKHYIAGMVKKWIAEAGDREEIASALSEDICLLIFSKHTDKIIDDLKSDHQMQINHLNNKIKAYDRYRPVQPTSEE